MKASTSPAETKDRRTSADQTGTAVPTAISAGRDRYQDVTTATGIGTTEGTVEAITTVTRTVTGITTGACTARTMRG